MIRIIRTLFLAAAVSLTIADTPRRIYIAPDDHTDYMWSGDEEAYRQAYLEMIDYYLDQADRTAKHPSAQQGRWNLDGSFWMWTYEKNKTPEQFRRLLDRIRDGHMNAPLNAVVSCYGGMPLEAVSRGMYYSGASNDVTVFAFLSRWRWKTRRFPTGSVHSGPDRERNTVGRESAAAPAF